MGEWVCERLCGVGGRVDQKAGRLVRPPTYGLPGRRSGL